MANLSVKFAGLTSPNPFWLASGPPANTGEQVMRAFDAGWGGAVWKTIGDPIVNVASRYSALHHGPQRMIGFNNIELISDRPIEDNLREIAEKAAHRERSGGAAGLATLAASFLNFTLTQIDLPTHVWGLQAAVGLLMPIGEALYPIFSGTRLSVHDAIYEYGLNDEDRKGLIDKILAELEAERQRILAEETQ